MSAAAAAPLNAETPILVIDDQPLMVDLIRRIILHLGYENVDHAKDGLTALLMMARKPYRLVISDWRMEPVSGIDLLKVIRADRKLKATRFLIMTASMSTEAVVEARSAGVDNFILKPFTPEALHAKIVELI